MVTIEEARSQVEARKQELATAQRGIQSRQAALPETRTQRALRAIKGIAGVPTKQRVKAEREVLAGQEREVERYGAEISEVEAKIGAAERAKATYFEKQAAYKKARTMFLGGEHISRATGYVKDYLKKMQKRGVLMSSVQERAIAKELKEKGFEPVYEGGKLVGVEDPYAQMSVGLHELPKHLERYDMPRETPQLAYKDTFTGELTSAMPDTDSALRRVPVAISQRGVELAAIEQAKLRIMRPELFRAPVISPVPEGFKEVPLPSHTPEFGTTVPEDYRVETTFVPERRAPPISAYELSKKVIKTAVVDIPIVTGRVIAEQIPDYGKGIKIKEGAVVQEGFYEVPSLTPDFGTVMPEDYKRLEWRRKEVHAPLYIFGAERVKEAVEFGVPAGVGLAAGQAVPSKLVPLLIGGLGAVETVKATKEISELEAQKIDISEIRKDIGEKPAGVLPQDWEKYKAEYISEVERYNKELEEAIKSQRTSRMIGVAGVGLGVGIGAVAGGRAASRFLRTKVVREVPLPLAKPKAVVVQKIVDVGGKPKTVSVLEVRGEVSPWIIRTTTTKGREIKDFFGKKLEKVVKVGDEPMLGMRAPPKVELIPHRPFIIRTTAPAIEGRMFTTAEAVAGRKQLKISKLFDVSKKTKVRGEVFLRGPSGEKLVAEKVKSIEQFLIGKLPSKKDVFKIIKDKDSLRTSFGFAQDISKVRVTPRTFVRKQIPKSPVKAMFGVSEVRDVVRLPKMDIFGIKTVAKRIKSVSPRPTGKVQELDTTLIRLKGDLPFTSIRKIGKAEFGPVVVPPSKVAKKLTAKWTAKPTLKEKEEIKTIAELVKLPTPRIPKPTVKVSAPGLIKTDIDITAKTMAPQIISYERFSLDDRVAKPTRKEITRAKEIVKVQMPSRTREMLAAREVMLLKKRVTPVMKTALVSTTLYSPIKVSVTRPMVKPALKPILKPLLKPALKPATRPISKPITKPPKPPKPPKPIIPIIPIIIRKKKPRKVSPRVLPKAEPKPGYEVEVKRKGKWVDVTPFALSEGEALALGRRETKAGAEVSFRLKKADGVGGTLNLAPITRAELKKEYRGRIVKGKEVKTPTTFIQKRKARIATRGEFLAITAKGIEKRKSKARGITW